MKRLQRFSPYDAAKVLRDGIAKGLWTLEDLDTPSPHFRENLQPMSAMFPGGRRTPEPYKGVIYRNPLRTPDAQQAVSISDPRDFTPAPGHTPALDPPAPLSPPSDDHRPPAPTQPVSVTDDPVDPRGVTVYTNADDPNLWF